MAERTETYGMFVAAHYRPYTQAERKSAPSLEIEQVMCSGLRRFREVMRHTANRCVAVANQPALP